MDRESNLTNEQLEVFNTIKSMLDDMNGKSAPLLISGAELKRKFPNKDIRRELMALYRMELIVRRKGINDYLLTIKNYGLQRGNN